MIKYDDEYRRSTKMISWRWTGRISQASRCYVSLTVLIWRQLHTTKTYNSDNADAKNTATHIEPTEWSTSTTWPTGRRSPWTNICWGLRDRDFCSYRLTDTLLDEIQGHLTLSLLAGAPPSLLCRGTSGLLRTVRVNWGKPVLYDRITGGMASKSYLMGLEVKARSDHAHIRQNNQQQNQQINRRRYRGATFQSNPTSQIEDKR